MESIRLSGHTRSGRGGPQLSVILLAALSQHHDPHFLWRTFSIPKCNYTIPLEWAVSCSTSPQGHSTAFLQQIFLEYLLCARH